MAWCGSICEVPDDARPQQTVIGVDLGVNTLIAATDGAKVILISGRAAKATIQYRNKQLASIQQAPVGKEKGRVAQAAATAQVRDARQGARGVSAISATRPRARWLWRSPAPRAMWASRSTTPPSASGAYRRNR